MGDLISRETLLQVPNVRKVTEYDEAGYSMTYLAVPVDAIKDAPAVDAEPVRRGEWIECLYYDEDGYTYSDYKCSECGRYDAAKEPYCHCGAKMK